MKTAEIQDFHSSPNWVNQSQKDADTVAKACEEYGVSAITSAGDFNHRAVVANSSHNWDKYLGVARTLQSAAPVYFIYGTPGHDNPGSYASFKDIGWTEVSIGSHYTVGNLLIVGLPEISPEVIAARFPEKSKTEIIEAQYDLVQAIFDKFYGPVIKTHDGPSLFMGHGHVSGMMFKDSQKPRTSDFMYSESMLSGIGATRYQFGHLHLQQDFKTIWGGYGGSAHMTWNETGFQPGFNIVDWDKKEVIRIPFEKFERKKIIIKDIADISSAYAKIDAPRDYWLEIECNQEAAKEIDVMASMDELRMKFGDSIGPNSKITLDIQREEAVRVDAEEYEKCQSLEDVYKLYRKDATTTVLQKVREAESACDQGKDVFTQKHISILSLLVHGGIPSMENGSTDVFIDFEKLGAETNIFKGPNGTGKSFYLGLCHPYSIHLPTGARLQGLFKLKDSEIIRKFRVNDQVITQKIQIDPTLKNPTAKFYMDIDGKPVEGCKGNVKPFDIAVDEIFGPKEPFMTYVFKGQKDYKGSPSLETASETELRDIYTQLSGIDRGPIKQYAHDKVIYLGKQNELYIREIDTLKSTMENPEDVSSLETQVKSDLSVLKKNKSEKDIILSGSNKELDKIRTAEARNSEIDTRIETLEAEISEIITKKQAIQDKLDDFGSIDTSEAQTQLKQWRDAINEHTRISVQINQMKSEYNDAVFAWMDFDSGIASKMDEIKRKGSTLASEIKSLESEIESLRKQEHDIHETIKTISIPCEFCGKLSSDIQNKVDNMNNHLLQIDYNIDIKKSDMLNKSKEKDILLKDYYNMSQSKTPKPQESSEIMDLSSRLPYITGFSTKIVETEKLLENADTIKSLEQKMESIEDDRVKKAKEIETAQESKTAIDIIAKSDLISRISEISQEISNITSEIGSKENELKSLATRMEKIKQTESRIEEISAESGHGVAYLREWEEIESAFSPKGIPAMELSLLGPIVDRMANEWLSANCPRYKVETVTQDFDSTGELAEKFKILVHDAMNDEVKNLPVISGGQSVWVTRAIRESLNHEAKRRSGIVWDYSIEDEQDASLDHDIMPEYYDMVSRSLDGRKMYAVSHSPEAWASADNVMDITDFYGGDDDNQI